MRQRNLDEELLQDSPSKRIGDVLHDLKDMTDDFNQQQAQVRFLIWQCAERQRQEASTKISIKNWWKYELQGSRDYFAMESHRQSLIEFYAKEAGIVDGKIKSFKYSNYVGRNLSPFCVVDTGDSRTRQLFLEHMKGQYANKVKEWVDSTLQTEIGAMRSDRYNKTGVNGTLVFEPMISTFDKVQSIPLKLVMTVISELRPDLTWKKDWAHNTVFIPDAAGQVETYLAWCALDHLHGRCVIYINEELFDKRAFRQAITAQEFAWTSRKGWGKSKSKTLATVGNLSRDDVVNPEGSFMEQIGLAKSEGKGKRNAYSTTVERAMKSELPFRIEVLSLATTEFVKTYNEHLYKLLTRWS
ncbi:unnamed protein product [Symbiodinium natans]|uniref:Uncharacterized protein n=1 Tax=Symbiodinium natans TaxID=878477 RepID=A0A812NAM1_9DINO|nr:unnamed protein product [Symbiodinium natans]